MEVVDLSSLLSWLFDQIQHILDWLVNVLPDSPFSALDFSSVLPILPYLNYFFPVDLALDALTAWVTSMVGYYAYSVILRWIKVIG